MKNSQFARISFEEVDKLWICHMAWIGVLVLFFKLLLNNFDNLSFQERPHRHSPSQYIPQKWSNEASLSSDCRHSWHLMPSVKSVSSVQEFPQQHHKDDINYTMVPTLTTMLTTNEWRRWARSMESFVRSFRKATSLLLLPCGCRSPTVRYAPSSLYKLVPANYLCTPRYCHTAAGFES